MISRSRIPYWLSPHLPAICLLAPILFILVLFIPISVSGDERPNIILIVADDLSPTLGCYGDRVAVTPNIDALAERGVRFDYAFCTTASCSPSRSVILSGKYNHANGQYGLQHNYHHFESFHDVRSLGPWLTQAGYRTVRVGKFHVAPESAYQFSQHIRSGSRNPVAMAKDCRGLFQADSDQPFFLFYCTSDPHRGGGVVKDHPHQPDRFGNRAAGHAGVEPVEYQEENMIVPDFLPDHAATRAELAQYYQSSSRVDQGVGQLIKELHEAGKLENTIVIFTSDHGMAFVGAKTCVYEPGLRVPLIVADPRQPRRDFACDAMVSLVDLAPTILEFAGVSVDDKELHGRSFTTTLDKEHPQGWDEIYASHTFHEVTMYYPMRVVRNRRYKLIWNIAHPLSYPFASDLWRSATWQTAMPTGQYGPRTVEQFLHRDQFELYDLQNDPNEVKNLANTDEGAEMLAIMQKQLKDFQTRTSDPWLLKWNHE